MNTNREQRPTPETDALHAKQGLTHASYREFARKLERERDEAREQLDTARYERDSTWEQLASFRWTPVTERMPTVEDADDYHDVEWSDGVDRWDNQFTTPNIGNCKATHWRRITLP